MALFDFMNNQAFGTGLNGWQLAGLALSNAVNPEGTQSVVPQIQQNRFKAAQVQQRLAEMQMQQRTADLDRLLKAKQFAAQLQADRVNKAVGLLGTYFTAYEKDPQQANAAFGAVLPTVMQEAGLGNFALPGVRPGTTGSMENATHAETRLTGNAMFDAGKGLFDMTGQTPALSYAMGGMAKLAGQPGWTMGLPTDSGGGFDWPAWSTLGKRSLDAEGQQYDNALKGYDMTVKGDPAYIASQVKAPGILNNQRAASANESNESARFLKLSGQTKVDLLRDELTDRSFRRNLAQQELDADIRQRDRSLDIQQQGVDVSRQRLKLDERKFTYTKNSKGQTVINGLTSAEKNYLAFARSKGINYNEKNFRDVIAKVASLVDSGAIDYEQIVDVGGKKTPNTAKLMRSINPDEVSKVLGIRASSRLK